MSTLTRDSTRACDPIRISDSSNPGPPRMSESTVMDQVRISESSNTDVPRKPVRTKSMQRGDRPQGISSTTSMPQMDQSQRLQDLQNELIQVKMIKYYCASMRVRIKTVKCLCVSRRVKSQTILLSLGNHRVNPLSAGFRFYCLSVLSRKRTWQVNSLKSTKSIKFRKSQYRKFNRTFNVQILSEFESRPIWFWGYFSLVNCLKFLSSDLFQNLKQFFNLFEIGIDRIVIIYLTFRRWKFSLSICRSSNIYASQVGFPSVF